MVRLTASADARRLKQLFANLLENSLRYTDADGCLVITGKIDENQIILCFEDSSPSVPDESLEKLFERLYRVDQSRSRASGGAGLGLSICRNIVAAHGGEIRASHSEFGGLCVQIVLSLQE